MPSEALLNIIVVGLLLCTVAFGFGFGGKVEKAGAALLGANFVAALAVQGVFGSDTPVLVFVLIDLSTAFAFGVLAVRNPEKLWPGVAGVAMTFVMVFSATRAIGFPLSTFGYIAAINLSGLLVEASLVAGAWSDRRARRAAALAPNLGCSS